MPPSYLCAVCGRLALPINSNLVDGRRFVHRACKDKVIDEAITRYVKERK